MFYKEWFKEEPNDEEKMNSLVGCFVIVIGYIIPTISLLIVDIIALLLYTNSLITYMIIRQPEAILSILGTILIVLAL